ncbi:hypothetical protein FQA39_LY10457 [Lamprigera yunnana]|nr:hypothetical protein FQA39_LY10457 [Lamprigera yunnana]
MSSHDLEISNNKTGFPNFTKSKVSTPKFILNEMKSIKPHTAKNELIWTERDVLDLGNNMKLNNKWFCYHRSEIDENTF